MWIGLTGSPEISGVVFDGQLAVEGALVPEHVVATRRGGLEIVRAERLRPEGAIEWSSLSAETHYQLMRATATEFDLRLRTEQAGDPGPASARRVRVRRTSAVELTTPNNRRLASTGQVVYRARIEWRAVRPEPAAVWLPIARGSLVLIQSAVAGTVYAVKTD